MSRLLVRELVTQEAIAYQKDPKLFEALKGIFEPVVQQGDLSEATLQATGKAVAAAIQDHTGITILVHWNKESNAYATIPSAISFSNPLLEAFKPFLHASDRAFNELVANLKKVDSTLTGWVDRKHSRVSGLFSKIACPVGIGTGLFSANGFVRMDGAEVAAIVLHEVGHLFTFFELLATSMMTNFAMEAVLQGLSRRPDEVLRIQLIEAAAEVLEAKGTNAKALAKEARPEIIQSVLLKNAVEYSRSSNSSRVYDFRGCEFLADQFASLHGAGRALAAALDKLQAWSNVVPRLQSQWSLFHNALMVSRMLFRMSLDVVTLPFVVLLLAMPGMDERSYDPPRERLLRIKRNLINALKDDRLSPAQREELITDVGDIDALVAKQPSGGFFAYVYRYLTSERRQQLRQEQFQQDLEALAANDLFVAASRLSTLSQPK